MYRHARLAMVFLSLGALPTLGEATPENSAQDQRPSAPAIHGAETPELISDELAWRHFLISIAIPVVPSIDEFGRRSAIMARLGLRPADYAVLLHLTEELHDALVRLESERHALRLAPSHDLHVSAGALEKSRDALFINVINNVTSALSRDGVQYLRVYLTQYVKPRIVVHATQ